MAAQDSAALERTAGEALQMMAEAVYAGGFLEFRPSLVAAGVLTSARRAAGAWPFWPSSLAQLTGDCPVLCLATPHLQGPSTELFKLEMQCRGWSTLNARLGPCGRMALQQ